MSFFPGACHDPSSLAPGRDIAVALLQKIAHQVVKADATTCSVLDVYALLGGRHLALTDGTQPRRIYSRGLRHLNPGGIQHVFKISYFHDYSIAIKNPPVKAILFLTGIGILCILNIVEGRNTLTWRKTMKIKKLGTKIKIKSWKKKFNCQILEVDELGNVIVQLQNERNSIHQFHPDEVIVTDTFRTSTGYFNQYGDIAETRTIRTATLRIGEIGSKPYWEWTANYTTRTREF